MKVLEPRTEKEFSQYYDLRWRILRRPWKQLRGSERDGLEAECIHIMAVEDEAVVGVGRGQMNSKDEAQVRYMAVEEGRRGKGVGSRVLSELEERLSRLGAKRVVLDARETAVGFYQKKGYILVGDSHTLFGSVPHKRMMKRL